jgi:hypothetical protein
MSAILPDFIWSASAPPPHCWKRSGGVLPCSASGTLVWNCSFCSGSIVNEVFGWLLWKSSAICCHFDFIGSVVRLCHQVSVTGPSVEASEPPPLHPASTNAAAAMRARGFFESMGVHS